MRATQWTKKGELRDYILVAAMVEEDSPGDEERKNAATRKKSDL